MSSMLSACLALAAAVALATPAAAQGWPIEDWNPIEDADDVVLPMPCAGAMAFRRVRTGPAEDPAVRRFGDVAVWLGWPGADETAYVEGEWRDFVSGGLRDDAARFYLIAKYELTVGQARALSEPECPDRTLEDGLPAGGLGWHDATALADTYARWLLVHAAAELPQTWGGPAYVRLPTEAEWEFAARGGLAVSDAERRNQRFPGAEDVSAVAWHFGTDSADGLLQYVGLKLPNPLGLYDVYGNVAEIVLDPFRLNRAGRLHGQPGGFLIKGGSIEAQPTQIRSGLRQEVPHYVAGADDAAVRRPEIGARFVIASPATGDAQHATELSRTWPSLGEFRSQTDRSPLQTLRTLAENASDLTIRNALQTAINDVTIELAERDALERETIATLLLSTALMNSTLDSIFYNTDLIFTNICGEVIQGITDETYLAEISTRLDQHARELPIFGQGYAETLAALIDAHDRDTIIEIARAEIDELDARGQGRLAGYMLNVAIQIRDFQDGMSRDYGTLIFDLIKTNRNIEERPEWFDKALARDEIRCDIVSR